MEIKVERAKTLKEKPDQSNLGFGKYFTDHMFVYDWDSEKGWHDARIVPYAPIQMDPATMVLHYAQETFEGMKASSGISTSRIALPTPGIMAAKSLMLPIFLIC